MISSDLCCCLSSQLVAALRRQHVPAERHERSLQQHGHPAAGAAPPPAARPLRAALPPAQLPVRQPGLLQLLHHEELLLRRGQGPGGSSHLLLEETAEDPVNEVQWNKGIYLNRASLVRGKRCAAKKWFFHSDLLRVLQIKTNTRGLPKKHRETIGNVGSIEVEGGCIRCFCGFGTFQCLRNTRSPWTQPAGLLRHDFTRQPCFLC